MAGPTVAALGPFQFEAHGFGFSDMARAVQTRWAEVPIAGAFNATQWTGGDGEVKSIRGVLFPERFGGQASLDGIAMAATLGQVLPLVAIGGGGLRNIFGLWIVEQVRDKGAYYTADGTPQKLSYDIDLRAYQGGAAFGAFSPISVITLFF